MKEQLLKEFAALDDREIAILRDAATSLDRAAALNAVLHHRENERRNPTPQTQKPSNYSLIHHQQSHTGEQTHQIAIFRAFETPQNIDQDETPRRFYYDDATPEEIADYESQIAGEAERAAIFEAAEDNAIHFRPETPPSDYSPTGRHFFTRPTLTQIENLIVIVQYSAIDN